MVFENGEVHFFEDIYGEDEILEQELARAALRWPSYRYLRIPAWDAVILTEGDSGRCKGSTSRAVPPWWPIAGGVSYFGRLRFRFRF
jgi:hypothetical protein